MNLEAHRHEAEIRTLAAWEIRRLSDIGTTAEEARNISGRAESVADIFLKAFREHKTPSDAPDMAQMFPAISGDKRKLKILGIMYQACLTKWKEYSDKRSFVANETKNKLTLALEAVNSSSVMDRFTPSVNDLDPEKKQILWKWNMISFSTAYGMPDMGKRGVVPYAMNKNYQIIAITPYGVKLGGHLENQFWVSPTILAQNDFERADASPASTSTFAQNSRIAPLSTEWSDSDTSEVPSYSPGIEDMERRERMEKREP
jgi:hypothetical protein